MNNGGNRRKRPPPPPSTHQQSPATKHQATGQTPPPPPTEEDFVDEDVFLDETLMKEEDVESLMLRTSRNVKLWLLGFPSGPALLSLMPMFPSRVVLQLEIDYVIGESNKYSLPDSSGPAAIIGIFGVAREGHSVCCLVHGFEPYFYISCPPGMGPDDISRFHQTLEGRMKEQNKNSKVPKFVRRIELVQRRSIMYYQQQKSQSFLKIVVALPTMVASCRGILDRGIQIDGLGMKCFMTYESNVLFALRFMIDCNIVGGNWIEIPAGKYNKTAKNLSYCQLEFDCLYMDLISPVPEREFSKMAPFRILSFDIECAGRKGHFPEPIHDPVIQVANLVTLQGEGQPFIRNVMTLKSSSSIVGVDVMSFDTEKEVLLAWKEFIREVDPDIIIGYNICKFDLPCLIKRSQTLGIAEFPILGRIKDSRVRVKDTTFSSRQYGTRQSKEVTVEGRVQFDLLQAMQRDYKLSSYSLNSVSAHFLSEQIRIYLLGLLPASYKEDVYHSVISDLQNGNAETRRRLAVYCLKIFDLFFQVLSQLLRKSKQKNLVIPNVKQAGSEQGTFEGATVIYDDTDSVMVQFGVPDVKAAMNLGREAVQPSQKWGLLFRTMDTPIKLEFEKVYYPYLLISKKRYAGLFWTNPQKFDKMDTKGIETVRRDNCLLVKNLVNECIHKILIDRDIPGAVQYVKNTISDLLMNRMDLSLLVITKERPIFFIPG
ncbi:hypothetical protein PTKIN_Ptkin14bG0054300 [Pterospermum kingtungense]